MHEVNSNTKGKTAQLAREMFGCEGEYGAVSRLSRQAGLSRKTLYKIKNKAIEILDKEFNPLTTSGSTFAETQITRQILTLFTEGHASLDGIKHCLEVFQHLQISKTYISTVINEAAQRALQLFASQMPQTERDVAIDEIFGGTHGAAYLNIVDVHSHAVWAATGPHPLDSETWELVLGEAEERGLKIKNTISDKGSAILCGVEAYFGDRLHRYDHWHVFHKADRLRQNLEAKLLKQTRHLLKQKTKQTPKTKITLLDQELNQTNSLLSDVNYLLSELHDLLGVVVLHNDRVLNLPERYSEINSVISLWQELATFHKVWQADLEGIVAQFKGIHDQLLAFAVDLEQPQEEALLSLGEKDLGLIAWAWQRRNVLGGSAQIIADLPLSWREQVGKIFKAWETAVRASSAVENWHSILRPHLAVHRRLSPAHLALLAVWHNYKVFARGKRAGKSPLQLSGVIAEPVDWLVALGYPPAKPSLVHTFPLQLAN